jgi:type I restriction enzyme R subunit
VEDGSYQVCGSHGYKDMPGMGIDIMTLVNFIQTTQPKAWARFEKQCNSSPEKKFYKVFQDAVDNEGIIAVLKHGFKHRGIQFRIVYFMPESDGESSLLVQRQNTR